jgi:hypothetical protein
MGKRHFTILCTILHNSYKINLYAFANTKANGFAFINTACAINTAKFLNIKVIELKEPIAVKGFNSKQGYAVTYFLTLHLSINRQ